MLRLEDGGIFLLEIEANSLRLFNLENFTNLHKYARILVAVTTNSLRIFYDNGSRKEAVDYNLAPSIALETEYISKDRETEPLHQIIDTLLTAIVVQIV